MRVLFISAPVLALVIASFFFLRGDRAAPMTLEPGPPAPNEPNEPTLETDRPATSSSSRQSITTSEEAPDDSFMERLEERRAERRRGIIDSFLARDRLKRAELERRAVEKAYDGANAHVDGVRKELALPPREANAMVRVLIEKQLERNELHVRMQEQDSGLERPAMQEELRRIQESERRELRGVLGPERLELYENLLQRRRRERQEAFESHRDLGEDPGDERG